MRESIIAALAAHETVGAPPTWVLSNHDTVREVSRYARPQGVRPLRKLSDLVDLPTDFAAGRRRARAAALLMLALPGGAYVYQGEELGLAEVEDLPDDVLQDPGWEQSGRTERGRDGCRVPIPWSGEKPPFGFSPDDASAPPWLPQPAAWRELTVEAETGDERSMLELYRRALQPPPGAAGTRRRHALAGLMRPTARWRSRVTRDSRASSTCPPIRWLLPDGAALLLSSGPLTDGRVPEDIAVGQGPTEVVGASRT